MATVVVEHTNMDDDHETSLVVDPPAPQPGEIVNYRDFLGIVLETLEERFLVGEPPSQADLEELESLQYRLNQRVLEVAHQGYLTAEDLGDGAVDPEQLAELGEALDGVGAIADEIETEHLE